MAKTNAELKAIAIGLVGEQELSRLFRAWIMRLIKKEQLKASNMTSDEFFFNQANNIIDDLNTRTGARFKLLPERLSAIRGRMEEGNEVEDFQRVHEIKVKTWTGTDMEKYLTPDTLWRASKFDNYLSEWYKGQAKNGQNGRDGRNGPDGQDSNAKGQSEQRAQRDKERAENEALVSELMGKAWWEFETFGELVLHVVKFPTEATLKAYPLPARLHQMRLASGVFIAAAQGKMVQGMEEEYIEMKRKHRETQS